MSNESDQPQLHEALRSEYALVQGKIDNLGEFKFRVRGWSLTLQTAIIAGVVSGKLQDHSSNALYVGVGLGSLLIIFLFHWLEQEKDFIGTALGDRAIKIERALDGLVVQRDWSEEKRSAILSSTLSDIQSTPRIGVVTRHATQNSLIRTLRYMARQKIYAFYFVQYIVTIAAVLAVCFLNEPSSTEAASPFRSGQTSQTPR